MNPILLYAVTGYGRVALYIKADGNLWLMDFASWHTEYNKASAGKIVGGLIFTIKTFHLM